MMPIFLIEEMMIGQARLFCLLLIGDLILHGQQRG